MTVTSDDLLLSSDEQKWLDFLVRYELLSDKPTPITELMLEVEPDDDSPMAALEALRRCGLVQVVDRDTKVCATRNGALASSEAARLEDLGQKILRFQFSRLAAERTSFVGFSWEELKTSCGVEDSHFAPICRLIELFCLSGGGTRNVGVPAQAVWKVAPFLVKLRPVQTMRQLALELPRIFPDLPRFEPAMPLTEDARTLLAFAYSQSGIADDGEAQSIGSEAAATSLKWTVGRFNRAFRVIENSGWIEADPSLGSAPYEAAGFDLTEAGILEHERALKEKANLGARREAARQGQRGSKIFIGHGRSETWRALKDFVSDRLNLQYDEFNRESTAGRSTKERLEAMLDQAAFAFLVMTAEDEHADGKRVARANVVHEIGLFQGRLGFERAIILLEHGCEEFSNIHGVTHIPFHKGNIGSAFEEVRRVLEREGVIRR